MTAATKLAPVKERPILFSGPMVLALLEGRKSQTRRVLKPQPFADTCGGQPMVGHVGLSGSFGEHVFGHCAAKLLPCPYGQPGDRLWLKEAWAWPGEEEVLYQATDQHLQDRMKTDPLYPQFKWKPPMYMKRAHSRLTLELTDVRVERLQDISEEDAKAEGALSDLQMLEGMKYIRGAEAPRHVPSVLRSARAEFRDIWESINGPGSWKANPWVWCLTFKKAVA